MSSAEDTVKSDGKIRFVDTTLRDGNQSQWALLMSTSMMLPIAQKLDEAGYTVIELTAPAHFKAIVRDVGDDPWERMRAVSKRITRTPLAVMQQTSITGFNIVPKCMARLWMERLAANGIRRIHLMEASNDFGLRVPDYVQFAREAGLEVALALTYSLSPKHTDEYFGQKTRDAAKLSTNAIFLKDPGGLLTPERVRTLVPVIQENSGGVPLEFHSHCTTGLAPLCYIEAAKLGMSTFHVGIPPLANANTQPSVLNVAENLRYLGYSPVIDEDAIRPVTQHFQFIAKRENRSIGTPLEYHYYQYIHQVPGGVIANLKRQLSQLKLINRLPEVVGESIAVRKDFGYPIMVTPFSQFIATQAAINVVLGKRYEQVIDDLIYYALGFWGKEAASEIDPNVMDKIMNLPRSKELLNWEFPEPTLDEMREKIGGDGVSDDDLLLRYIIGNDDDISAMRARGGLKENEYMGADKPLFALVKEILKKSDLHRVAIHGKGFELAIEKSSDATAGHG